MQTETEKSIERSVRALQQVSHVLTELNMNAGWHAPPHETWVLHRTTDIADELVAVQRVIFRSSSDGYQLQVMTYKGNCYTASPDIVLMAVGTLKR